MRKLILGVAMASTVLAAPAIARDGSYYIELGAGIAKAEDTDINVAGVKDVFTIDSKNGYDISSLLGYDSARSGLKPNSAIAHSRTRR